MIVLGLTGSIGMGKSTAANMLQHMGFPVHDADACVHDLLGPGGAGVACVLEAFPNLTLNKQGGIDRPALGQIVFQDQTARKTLESILHPLVRAEGDRFIQNAILTHQKLAVLDIPLLFETGRDADMDVTLCVTAPAFIQRQRVLRRPGMTAGKYAAILARQMPDPEKRARADYILQTGLGYGHSWRELQSIVADILDFRTAYSVRA